MKAKIDFILNEENGELLIFRFFPKKSKVEFAEGYNKDWSNIWNIVYDWKIIKQIHSIRRSKRSRRKKPVEYCAKQRKMRPA